MLKLIDYFDPIVPILKGLPVAKLNDGASNECCSFQPLLMSLGLSELSNKATLGFVKNSIILEYMNANCLRVI